LVSETFGNIVSPHTVLAVKVIAVFPAKSQFLTLAHLQILEDGNFIDFGGEALVGKPRQKVGGLALERPVAVKFQAVAEVEGVLHFTAHAVFALAVC
jgi:hypothetical protein